MVEHIDSENIIDYVNVDTIFSEVGFNGTPKPKHYEILDAIIEEANNNGLK
jgi:hypothetical protein